MHRKFRKERNPDSECSNPSLTPKNKHSAIDTLVLYIKLSSGNKSLWVIEMEPEENGRGVSLGS